MLQGLMSLLNLSRARSSVSKLKSEVTVHSVVRWKAGWYQIISSLWPRIFSALGSRAKKPHLALFLEANSQF
jgi:hypothetical protein